MKIRGVRSSEFGVRSDGDRKSKIGPPAVFLAALVLSLVCGLQSTVFSDWISDERMIASVTISQSAISLKDLCAELGRQTTSEFYVDCRDADTKIAWFADEMQLKTAMLAVESATGLQWRMVGDMFFLSRDSRGAAITRWNERYAEAKKAQLAGIRKSRVKEWVYYAMPFPPSADLPWQLTPLQMEQLAYHQSLLFFTMTPPQLNWLDASLIRAGYIPDDGRTAIDQAASHSLDVPVQFNAAMIVHTNMGDCLVEMPLTAIEEPAVKEPAPPTPTKVVVEQVATSKAEPKKTNLKDEMKGLWVTDDDVRNVPRLLRKAKTKGFNTLFLPVLTVGHTIYPGKKLPQDRNFKGSDPLKDTIKTAGDLGIKVHAVLDATLWGDVDHPVPTTANYPLLYERNLLGRTFAEQGKWQKDELTAMEPDAALPATGPEEKRVYLCPASSQLPRLLSSIAEEIAVNYQVAGICLDGVEYPKGTTFMVGGENLAPPYGYTLEVRREMIRLNQVDPVDVDSSSVRSADDAEVFALWDKFRRGRLTGLVNEVCGAFRAKRADGICSAALDLASDTQSPVHWSSIASLDAILPLAQIRRVSEDEQIFTFPKGDEEAVTALHRAVVKNAAVIPAVTGLTSDSLTDQIGVAAEVMKVSKNNGLKGYVLRGDAKTLTSALDMLPD